MKCKDCRFWQGHKYQEWADCYRVCGKLQPFLFGCYLTDEETGKETYFETPFDPHDLPLWRKNEPFQRLMLDLVQHMPDGVRAELVRVPLWINDEYGWREVSYEIYFFQTHRDYECKEDY
jgi:hypothetical protein